MSQEQRRCPRCGAEVPVTTPRCLCPACLLEQGLESQRPVGDSHSGPQDSPSTFTPPSPADLAPHFPNLEILELLGQGGMGAVYKARQPGLDRLVALKVLPPGLGTDPTFAERFTREARALAHLNHPNIVMVHDVGQAGDLYYFLMEYVNGVTLRQMERTERLAPQEALDIVVQVCEALQYAHDEGIVHRDIKPENILIDKKGHVKIADFGLAKLLAKAPTDFALTQPQQVMGTVYYMAPEQMEHPTEVDQRADIYSLGVVFYEMLTGELPLGRFAPPSQKVQVDVRLDDVVLKALEKEPERRYQKASQVRTDVEQISRGPHAPASPATPQPATGAAAQRPGKGRQTRTAWIVASILVGVLLVLLAVPMVGGLVAYLLALRPDVKPGGHPDVKPGGNPDVVSVERPGATASVLTTPVPQPQALKVPAGCRAKQGTVAEPYTRTGWADEIVHEATGIEMVFIPEGEFLMGSPVSETGRNENETQHKERISKPFYMGKYEVTQGEWQKMMGHNPSTFKGSDRLPVEQVSWNGCQAFCQRAGSGLRLPTEAEWEYACRAGTQTRYLSGDADSTLDDCAWYKVNSGGQTHPVGQKRPNAWGLYDMQGNVLEWCADYWYRENPGVGTARVRRGSCWGGGPRDCRSGSSDRASPDHTDYNNGFRVALDLLGKS